MPEHERKPNPPNHLILEKSPYLQQHAANPVDWYPWGEEAFRRAETEDRPVFLSIGYATCHWCHVMARESFEDEHIASILNAHFIAVKVDREERPDIDAVYMTACQQMTGQGGWPLTIIMTPDRKPFFAGTYFPRSARAGMTGLDELLTRVSRLWLEQRETLTGAADQLTARLQELQAVTVQGTADPALLTAGYEGLAASFDPVNGGFGRAPKFPVPATILFLLRFWKRTGSVRARSMAETTLGAMAYGGIQDHLGGGFHRYATDAAWRIPHFEKMLYDQALLLQAYAEGWQATRKPLFQQTAESIVTYVTRDLVSAEGAFLSAEDADSAGGEGAFYLWTLKELDDALGPQESRYAAGRYGVREEGNFVSPETGPGKNILFLKNGKSGYERDPARAEALRKTLLAARDRRPRPRKDGKILADGNGLMIAALAVAARIFDRPDYYRTADAAMRFLLARLRSPDGGLFHRFCDGEAAIPAFADDYAFMIQALIELYGTGFEPAWLEEALALNRYLTRHFADPDKGGFFTAADGEDTLIVRKQEIYDGAIPSCNSVMLGNQVRFGHLTGDPGYEEQAARLADRFAGTVRASPSAYCEYLNGLDHLLGPAMDVVIAGEEADPVAREMVRVIRDRYLPSVTVHFRSGRTGHALDAVAPFTRAMTAQDGKATAYVCTGRACSAPVTGPEALRDLIAEKSEHLFRGS